MTRFTITCACKRSNMKFRSMANYGADIVSRLYCPHCIENAPQEAFIVEVKGARRHDGTYGFVWNMDAAKFYRERAGEIHENALYDLFGKKKLIFDFGMHLDKVVTYTILGFRAGDAGTVENSLES